ncbi:MAG: class I SAM-dependent methyltransferase [Candidatus Lindowbacteria bacterium]|nr:class I SAM-dependent methyltransferase [Candidatus Lindowbacteria bacterium]
MLKHDTLPCCSFCDSRSMTEIINFGSVALAGAFLKPEQFASEARYPLRLYFCNDCFAVQVIDKVNPGVLFKNYFYFSSAIRTLREHFIDYATEVTSRFLDPEKSTVIEFGCNDGVLLGPLADQKIRTVIGVDPATNIVKTINDPRITIVNDFFNEDVAAGIVADHGKADMIVANNVYAHIPEMQGVTRAIKNALKDDGVFVFEVHYLGKIIKELQYDMIYHEHLYYHSLLSLMKHFARYDMMIFDVKPVQIHAGSMRYYVCKKGSRRGSSISAQASALKEEELANGYHRAETYARFAADVADRKEKLMDLLTRLKTKGASIAGYGASGRANTMIQYCGIDHRYLDYMIDDAPAKLGLYTPGSHFLIQPRSVLDQRPRPDYLLIFAWSFFSEIAKKCTDYLDSGGRMIVPLPNVQIMMHPGCE